MAIFYFIDLIVAMETIQGRKLFKGGIYSRAETIPGRKLFAEIWCIEISSTLWPHCLLLMHLFHCVKKLKLNASNIWQVNALFFSQDFITKIAIDFFVSFLLLQGSDTGVGDLFRARKCKYYIYLFYIPTYLIGYRLFFD